MSEFKETWCHLAGCNGTLSCGCTVDEEDEFWAECLYRMCREYMRNYEGREAGHGE